MRHMWCNHGKYYKVHYSNQEMTLIVHIGVLLKLCKFREDIGSLNGQDVQDKMCP